jgi:hypothetical protein
MIHLIDYQTGSVPVFHHHLLTGQYCYYCYYLQLPPVDSLVIQHRQNQITVHFGALYDHCFTSDLSYFIIFFLRHII